MHWMILVSQKERRRKFRIESKIFLQPQKKGLTDLANPLLILAGATRLELATFGVTGRRSNQLNYAPIFEHGVMSLE